MPCYKTGGTELLHQLVDELNSTGHNALIYYYNESDSPQNEAFSIYNCPYVMTIPGEDNNENNILIVPEVNTNLLYKYSKMQKAIWWLSVDFFYNYLNLTTGRNSFEIKIKKCIKRILHNMSHFNFGKEKNSIVHLCQSRYASEFVKNQGCKNVLMLSDYINDIYFSKTYTTNNREDIILYNPQKGRDTTEQIIQKYNEYYSDTKWIALEKMTNEEVRSTLERSKVYIDFGNHPGKDRFPREAAICYCCIITGLKGAAKYQEDIDILPKYKIEDGNIEVVVERIRDCIVNYSDNITAFKPYRDKIVQEKNVFKKQVHDIFKDGDL